MRLFFFGKVTSETSQKLLCEIENSCSPNIEIFQTVTGLTKRLCQIGEDPDLFIFSPSTNKELSELVAQKELFNDYPIILVLHDHSNSTIHNGHLLMPNFLTFWDSNLTEVAAVLEKIRVSNLLKSARCDL